jgi:hypothetical protein
LLMCFSVLSLMYVLNPSPNSSGHTNLVSSAYIQREDEQNVC